MLDETFFICEDCFEGTLASAISCFKKTTTFSRIDNGKIAYGLTVAVSGLLLANIRYCAVDNKKRLRAAIKKLRQQEVIENVADISLKEGLLGLEKAYRTSDTVLFLSAAMRISSFYGLALRDQKREVVEGTSYFRCCIKVISPDCYFIDLVVFHLFIAFDNIFIGVKGNFSLTAAEKVFEDEKLKVVLSISSKINLFRQKLIYVYLEILDYSEARDLEVLTSFVKLEDNEEENSSQGRKRNYHS